MTTPIGSTPSPTATATTPDAKLQTEFQNMMGEKLFMQMQESQQSMNKSMSKVTDSIKKAVNDDE